MRLLIFKYYLEVPISSSHHHLKLLFCLWWTKFRQFKIIVHWSINVYQLYCKYSMFKLNKITSEYRPRDECDSLLFGMFIKTVHFYRFLGAAFYIFIQFVWVGWLSTFPTFAAVKKSAICIQRHFVVHKLVRILSERDLQEQLKASFKIPPTAWQRTRPMDPWIHLDHISQRSTLNYNMEWTYMLI